MRWAIATLLLLASACSAAREDLRELTYPPDFRYLERNEVRTSMRALAAELQAIDALLRDTPAPDAAGRTQILTHLRALETAAAQLDGGIHTSNRPMIDANLAAFQRDVTRAREAVEHEPPGYFLAGTVAGSCLYCHSGRP